MKFLLHIFVDSSKSVLHYQAAGGERKKYVVTVIVVALLGVVKHNQHTTTINIIMMIIVSSFFLLFFSCWTIQIFFLMVPYLLSTAVRSFGLLWFTYCSPRHFHFRAQTHQMMLNIV